MSAAAFNLSINESIAKEANGLFGVVLAAIDGSGNVFYKNQAGRRSLSSKETLPYDAFFSCYSVTKPLTVICALQCVERGLIGLDDDVAAHLPELCQQPLTSLSNDSLSYTSPTRPVTLRHLLTHTSGLAYDGTNPILTRWRKESQDLPPQWKCGDVLKAYSTPRVFEAGQDWHYGSGVDWAGLLVSRLNKGKTLGQYMEENVFRPVGATDSTFHPKQKPDLEKKRLEMVGRSSTGGFEPAPPYWPYPEDATGEAGGLGLFSTVPDLIKVIGDLASKSPILLNAASIDLMFTPQFQSHEGVREGLIRMQFMYQNLTGQGPLGEDGKMNVAQGIGGALTLQDTANLPKNTLTWGGMPHLAWFVNRDLGVAGIFASQLVPPGDRESNAMIASFFKEMIRQASQTGI
ncbi:unnamed protein product [Clonostachys chloroleuca]|uniref:Beta-lactamase-related domain-containing protein n=1 Tax=Clonostachys chloroleuca TaxID=1926264 RepID=A0AA35MDV9_9HYPO|nr:unnamed protein product [Clonostachys chloroleuca]